ncbi:Disease resistance protein RPM1 [Triticum urartu]|uniref:Disease resistance protein RPM1 n=1 Tax=Triticum urartu TaxID=4572 RepID=M8A7M4_TRIUA|nr:Disease resistance protein RPM1 [Triticum urartu]
MDPASGAIDSLLPKLEDLLLLCRGKLRKKARKELIFLKEKLTEIQLAFREVEDEPADQLKAQIKDWLRQARALSYCIEHVVDKFKWAIANASRQFAKEVETQRYRDRITELVNQHLDWSNTAGAAPSPRSGNASAMVANDHDGPVNELVDLDGRVEVLVSKILAVEEGEGQLKIASILGSAGVGKTTLVNRVYQQVNSQFECSAWVTVSQEPDIKHVLWTILCQISIQDYASFGSLSVEETVAEIRKALNNKRYFIVLEDLWDIKARETIKRALIDNSKGSAVLMTSHKVSVARYAGDNCPPDLVDISEKILEKCSGIPSSIINAANLLAGKTKEDWHNYLENPNAMRSRHLSYTGVPEHLKSCLLYLSMFQKGYEIRVDRLVSGWIAEGYIPEKANVTLQQQGEENVSELMERKLIEAVEVDADGKALSCRVNTMGHELIATLSAEENSVTILNKWEGQPLPQMVGRLAIQGQGHNANLPEDQISNVRSLIASDGANLLDGESGGGNVMSLLSNFVNLRVLELGGCSSLQNDHLKCIKSLLLLRYLVIGGDHITDIPKHIGYLKYLETLDLSASGVKELPATIVQARKLKCLRVNRHTKMPHGIGKMEALQELGDMNISNAELLRELSGLTNLKILRIVIWSWDDGYNDALLSYLGSPSMQKMKSLSIFTCCSLHIFEEWKAEQAPRSLQKLEIRHSSFLSLPGWICSLENLSCLSIEVYKLSQEIINILGKFPNLLALSLKSKQAPKGNFNDGFPKLTSLHFATNAAGRIFGPGAMLSLKRLDLSFQASRTEDLNHGFDFGLGNLSSLKHIRVEIVCFSANLEMVKKAKDAIMKAIYSGRSPGSEIHFDVPSELQSQQQSSTKAYIEQTESETNLHSPDQAEHGTMQQNQASAQFPTVDPSTSASHLSDNLQQHQSILSPHHSSLQA